MQMVSCSCVLVSTPVMGVGQCTSPVAYALPISGCIHLLHVDHSQPLSSISVKNTGLQLFWLPINYA